MRTMILWVAKSQQKFTMVWTIVVMKVDIESI